MERGGKLALFGHQAITTGRHVRAVFAAALAGSAATTAISFATVSLLMARTGEGPSGSIFAISAVVASSVMFVMLLIFYLAAVGLAFTGARAMLGRAGRNFGAFYFALALPMGTIEAAWTASYRGGLTPRELVFGVATWLLMALVYWMVAGERTGAEARVAEAFR